MKMMTAMYTMKRGGSYDRFIMMVEAFLERNWEVHCLSLTPIPIKHPFFDNHIMFLPFGRTDGFLVKLLVLIIFPFWSIWVGWRNKIDLIIAFGSLYAFIQSISKWSLNKPMVTLIRGDSIFGFGIQGTAKYHQHMKYLIKIIENFGLHFSERIITNNEATRDNILNNLKNGSKKDIQVLHNNIPSINKVSQEDISKIRQRYGIPKAARVLVTAGIINRGKNIEILIKCLSKIDIDNVYLLVAGDGSTKIDSHYKDSLKKLAEKLKVDEKVIFTGWLEKEELWKIYQASDLFVLPSLNEGMPNALLEALGCDLPCFGSDIPGINNILHYEELLFDPKNDLIIADKIENILFNKEYANHVLRLCQDREKIFIFDWKEKMFQMVTQGSFHRGGACQSK